MTLSVSETSLVPNISQIHSECNQIVIHDEDDNSDILDVEEYRPNGVSFDHAAVNIDNSQDVILGPVTQFNVSGNVTIYSNGNSANGEALPEPAVINQEQTQTRINLTNGGSKKEDHVFYCFQVLHENKTYVQNFALFLGASLIFFIIAIILIDELKTQVEEYNYNFTEYNYGDHLGSHKIFYRVDWDAKPPKSNLTLLKHPVNLIIFSHTLTPNCNTTETCSSLVRKVQMKHFSRPIRSIDIGYNFIIGGDGNIYVGRGWDYQNFQKKESIGISFIGDFNFDDFASDMIAAVKDLIKQGLELKKVAKDYILVGENQTNPRMDVSPGVNIRKVINNWQHFSNKTLF